MSQMMPQQGGVPPALLALLAQHQGAGAPPPAGPPAPIGEEPGNDDEREPIAILKQMIDLGNQFIKAEPDAEDKATMAKLLSTLHQYLAKEQSDAEAALGGGGATRVLRRLG